MIARVNGQYATWHDPHNNGSYVITNNATNLEFPRTTGGAGTYTDHLAFAFTDSSSGCELSGCSASQVYSIKDFDQLLQPPHAVLRIRRRLQARAPRPHRRRVVGRPVHRRRQGPVGVPQGAIGECAHTLLHVAGILSVALRRQSRGHGAIGSVHTVNGVETRERGHDECGRGRRSGLGRKGRGRRPRGPWRGELRARRLLSTLSRGRGTGGSGRPLADRWRDGSLYQRASPRTYCRPWGRRARRRRSTASSSAAAPSRAGGEARPSGGWAASPRRLGRHGRRRRALDEHPVASEPPSPTAALRAVRGEALGERRRPTRVRGARHGPRGAVAPPEGERARAASSAAPLVQHDLAAAGHLPHFERGPQ